MKKIITLSILSFGVIILAGCSQQKTSQTQSTTSNSVIQQPIQSDTNQPTSEDFPSEESNVPEGWNLYSSDDMDFSIYYDPSLTVKEDTKKDVRFYKYGPTQKGQTEMYDGIILSVLKVEAADGGQSYIDTQMEQYKDVGKITEPLHDGNLNGIAVKEYSASGLGDSKIIFVPIDSRTLLEISYMAPDPTNAGFQETIDLMLSTFNLKR